jgi:hypothetical protein
MTDPEHVWLFRVQLPAGISNPGRYMAAVLKFVWRRFGVKATAVLDAPPTRTHQPAQAGLGIAEVTGRSPAAQETL